MTLQCLEIARSATLAGGIRSGREILFKCPCHDDRHPSLSINPEKNCWLCGPCGKSGNAWELAAFISGNDPDSRKAVSTWLHDRGLLNGKNGWELRYKRLLTKIDTWKRNECRKTRSVNSQIGIRNGARISARKLPKARSLIWRASRLISEVTLYSAASPEQTSKNTRLN